VSGLNACHYCQGVHQATAEAFGISGGMLAALLADVGTAPVAGRMKPLLRYVGQLTLTPAKITPGEAEAVLATACGPPTPSATGQRRRSSATSPTAGSRRTNSKNGWRPPTPPRPGRS
jgi:hypothetical protein